MHDSVLLNAEGCSEGRQWYLCLRIDSGAGCGTSKWAKEKVLLLLFLMQYEPFLRS